MAKTKRIIPEKDNGLKRFYRNHPVFTHFLLICLTGCVLLWGIFVFFDIFTRHGSETTIPDIRGMSYNDAVHALEEAGLVAEIADSVYNDSIPPGHVRSVWPSEGAVVKPGRSVFLVVSAFHPRMISIREPLVHMSSSQARAAIEHYNIPAENIEIRSVPGEFADLVVRALYNGRDIHPGMQIPVNGKIVLEVSTGYNRSYHHTEDPAHDIEFEEDPDEETTGDEPDVDEPGVDEPEDEPAGEPARIIFD